MQILAKSAIGQLKSSVASDGTYRLFLPKGQNSWNIGAGFSGYADQFLTIESQVGVTTLTQNFALVAQAECSWRSHQVSSTAPLGVWISCDPAFVVGDEAAMQVTAHRAGVAAPVFEAQYQEIYVEVYPEAGVSTVALDVVYRGQTLKMNFDVLAAGAPAPNPYVMKRVSHISGTSSKVSLLPTSGGQEDLSGFEIPPFGVSSNVDAIRAEPFQSSTTQQKAGGSRQKTGLRDGAKIYRIDAYGVDAATGTTIKQGNDQIDTIFLTLSYDPNSWNPTLNDVVYSEDDGLTWLVMPRSSLIAIDTKRYTVTVQTSHLSLWAASLLVDETPSAQVVGIPTASSSVSAFGGGGGGGGCLLSSGL